MTADAPTRQATKVEVLHHQPETWTPGYPVATCTFTGNASTARRVCESQGQWALRGVLTAGAELEWSADHDEEAFVVLRGRVTVDGGTIGAGGALLLEAGVPAKASVVEDAEVVHFGTEPDRATQPGPYGPADLAGHHLHVLDGADVPEFLFDDYEATGHGVRWYADSSCPTCRMTLLQPRCIEPRVSASHTHTQDELIHVTHGAIRVGALVIEAGSTVCVPALYRYGFRTEGPYEFLNYRSDGSFQSRRSNDEPWLESAPITTELVGRGGGHGRPPAAR